jgi:hypothetical protein
MTWVATTIARRLLDATAEMRDATWARPVATEVGTDPKRGAAAELSVEGCGAAANFAMARAEYASRVLPARGNSPDA